MKKEDYMHLSKERLAELLEERDNEPRYIPSPTFPVIQTELPCYAEGGICTNPFHDCINCPRQGAGGFVTIDTNTTVIK